MIHDMLVLSQYKVCVSMWLAVQVKPRRGV
jgi:hypothetical protein